MRCISNWFGAIGLEEFFLLSFEFLSLYKLFIVFGCL